MDELEFRKRVYADPANLDEETLQAASENPDFQRILDQTKNLDTRVTDAARNTVVPEGLRAKLLAIPTSENSGTSASTASSVSQPWYRNFALAASLVLAIGASASFFIERGPDEGDLAFGNQVIAHIYHEVSQIDAINAGSLQRDFSMPIVNEVMANSGALIRNADFLQQMPVRYANPCLIANPFNSSHLILQSDDGAINIITIDNEPVSQEFFIADERFSGIVIPLAEGNLIIIGEKEQDLGDYRDLFSENLEWII